MNIKKNNLMGTFKFLEKISLVGSASRSRTKLNKEISELLSDLQEDEKKLVEEHGGKIKEDGIVDFEDSEHLIDFNKDQFELRQEEVILTEKTKDQFKNLKEALYNYDEKISGQDATIYDLLLDSLEAE